MEQWDRTVVRLTFRRLLDLALFRIEAGFECYEISAVSGMGERRWKVYPTG
ncbi:hypothetical protein GWO43_23675 [candidate division KSB1 bacterium]|nr:hypothetical protein [candidate division KSB1 bacterium]NIT73816.1 hypothetical protein [candidate division KSB1 bacterium]NIX73496.1 hypothetical protein [candidate division KSB1 bacterium]